MDSGSVQVLDSSLLSLELGFWIPIASTIPDSLNCIPDSKAQDSGFYMQIFPDSRFHKLKFPGFWNPDNLKWGDLELAHPLSGSSSISDSWSNWNLHMLVFKKRGKP